MSFAHEAVASWPTPGTGDPDRGLIRAMTTRRFAYCLLADEAASDFVSKDPVSGVPPLYLIQNSLLFAYDETDHTTVGDGVTCLVTNDACRYKLDESFAGSLSFANISGTLDVSQLPALGFDSLTGTIDPDQLPDGLVINVAPSVAWGVDATGESVALTNTGSVTFPSGSGMVLVTNHADGNTGLFICGGGSAVLVSQIGTSFQIGTPASGKAGLYYDGAGHYVFNNNTGSTATFGLALIRTRPFA